MDVYKVFLCLPFLVLEGNAPSPINHYVKPPSTHARHSWDTITQYSQSKFSIYDETYLPDGHQMHFYSQNVEMDKQTPQGPLMRRAGQELSIVAITQLPISLPNANPLMNVKLAGSDHIKFYADYWHGKMQSGNHRAYNVIFNNVKMCCNIIIHYKAGINKRHPFSCAAPACYRIFQGQHGEACLYLGIDPRKLDELQYTTCMKEIAFKNPRTQLAADWWESRKDRVTIYGNKIVDFNGNEIGVAFISKNRDLGAAIGRNRKIVRNHNAIRFTAATETCTEPSRHRNRIPITTTVAENYIKAYADVMHGNRIPEYNVIYLKNKMCCNFLIQVKELRQEDTYAASCAHPACFRPLTDSGRCPYLNIERDVNSRDFKSCWMEI